MAEQVKTYRIEIERDEAGYWVATAPDVPGMVTQAKRLDKIAARTAKQSPPYSTRPRSRLT